MPSTFTHHGYEYPNDGPHARMMARFLPPPDPSYPGLWPLFRDWAKKHRAGMDDMEAMLIAYDSGDMNVVLRGRPDSIRDLEEIAGRLGLGRTAAANRVASRFLTKRRYDIPAKYMQRVGTDWHQRRYDQLPMYPQMAAEVAHTGDAITFQTKFPNVSGRDSELEGLLHRRLEQILPRMEQGLLRLGLSAGRPAVYPPSRNQFGTDPIGKVKLPLLTTNVSVRDIESVVQKAL